MTINYVKRFVKDVNIENDICNFSKFIPELHGVSAMSWEFPNMSRRQFGAQLLKEIYYNVTGDFLYNTYVLLQLTPEQPDNTIVRYKKTWGLVEGSGIKLDDYKEHKSFIDKGNNGLVLTGICRIKEKICNSLQELINSEENLFFSDITPLRSNEELHSNSRMDIWLKEILNNNGFVFFLLGRFDEKDAEIVVVSKHPKLKMLYKT